MKKIVLSVLIMSVVILAEAKATYYRFVEMNMYREFEGVEQVVEGEAKKIECFQFKYDKSNRPVEIRHLTKMNESAGDFAGLGEEISMLSIEYDDSIFTVYDSISGITYKYKNTEAKYKAFNNSKEQVPFRGKIYSMIHSSTRQIIKDDQLENSGYSLDWKNVGSDGLLCEDYLGVKRYFLDFINNGGLRIVKSTRIDENNYPITDNNGVTVIEFQYNDAGQLVYQTFKDGTENRIDSKIGYCEMRIERVDSNNTTAKINTYFDKDGLPAKNSVGAYSMKYFYDANKYLTAFLYLDTVGKPAPAADMTTYARFIRDNLFYTVKTEYFTSVKDSIKKTPPQLKIEGVPMFFMDGWEYKYDKKGILTEKNKIEK
ncbi:MAG: hypothetical protein AB7T10_07970 [bacterium]